MGGCFWDNNNQFYFNVHTTGASNNRATPVCKVVYDVMPDHNCGGKATKHWERGGKKYGYEINAGYKSGETNLETCKHICWAEADCAGFLLRDSDSQCSLWQKGPLDPKPRKGIHCYSKQAPCDY